MPSAERRRGGRLDRWAIGLAAVSLAVLAILAGRPSFTNASHPPRGIPDSFIALQMARNIDDVDGIIADAPSPDREVMRIKLYENFAFSGCYAALYLVIAVAARRRAAGFAWSIPLAVAIVLAAIATAGFDVWSSLGMLRLVDVPLIHTAQASLDSIRFGSLMKWALATLAMVLVAPFFLVSRKWVTRAAGGINVAAALAGLAGFLDNAWFVWAIGVMAAALLADAVTLRFVRYEPAS